MAPFPMQERVRLAKCGKLNDQLPIQAGATRWDQMRGYCASCTTEVELYGEAVETFRDMFHVKAIGVCRQCQLVTCFDYNLKEGAATGYDRDGNWTVWQAVSARPTLVQRLKQLFGFAK